jgi:apolipoprotein N-acyltransferase
MVSSKEKLSLFSLAKRRPYRLVLVSGILLAASFPPSPLNFFIYVAFVPLMVLFEKGIVADHAIEDGIFLPFKRIVIVLWRLLSMQFLWRKNFRWSAVMHYETHEISGNAQLFRYSYATFFIWNALCCYWLMLTALGASNIAEGMVNAVAGVLAIALNPLLMAVPLQFQARLRRFLAPEWAALALIVFWLAFEYLHLNWELNWPWLTLGNAMSDHPAWIQYAEYTGVLGISAQILLVNWLAYLGLRWLQRKVLVGGLLLALAVGVFAFPLLLNGPLTDPARPALQAIGQLKVRMIQPNVDPYAKGDELTPEQRISRYTRLILSQPLDTHRIIILPEKAIAQPLEPRTMLKGRMLSPLWDIVDSFQVEILTGLEDFEDFDDTIEAPISARENYRLVDGKRQLVYSDHYNSAWIINASRSTQVYRKGKLVPMVERVPFLRGLRWLKFLRIDPAKGMLSYGRPDSLILLPTLDSIPTNVLICYESAFGDHTRQKTAMGAQWIAMITNDGWWRQSSGYIQHAGMSIIRAIENRRTLARCANNGRSMIVDATGQTSQVSAWGTEALIDADIPLYDYQTFYVRNGDYIGVIACWLSAVLIAISWVLRLLAKKKPPLGPVA